MEETIKIGFIGCGRVGSSLAKYFIQKGLNVVGVFDRTPQNAQDIAKFVGTASFVDKFELIALCNVIFITVSDSSISTIWNEITNNKKSSLSNKIFVHCSGATSSQILQNPNQDITVCSIHPAQAFCDKYKSYLDLPKTVFTLEYDKSKNNKNIKTIHILLQKIGNQYAEIDCQSKTKYHAGCVMASNLVVALASFALDTLEECNMPKDIARNLLGSLLVGNAENILQNGPIKALTGPIDRNDIATVKSHLSDLSTDSRSVYIQLSQKLISIAKTKNPDKDYTELSNLLSNQ